MSKTVIQFKYALNENGNLIDINSLSTNDRKDYECIGCGNVVRPILGQIRRKHFRHKVNHECSFETYLHKMGKLLFEANYRDCLKKGMPFLVEYAAPVLCNYCKHGLCEVTDQIFEYDIAKKFKKIHIEKRDENLIPDLLLTTDDNNKIYIEIAVTHESSENKLRSGVKIIEFKITSEDDLQIFKSRKISIRDDHVYFYNFEPNPIKKDAHNYCSRHISYFVVYPNGKCSLNTDKMYEYEKISNNGGLYINEVKYPSGMSFVEEAEKAHLNGIKVKNCFLCRYHAVAKWFQRGDNDDPIFCKLYKKNRPSNFAANCEAYRPDPKVFKTIEKS